MVLKQNYTASTDKPANTQSNRLLLPDAVAVKPAKAL
jgi:hypothetical protein